MKTEKTLLDGLSGFMKANMRSRFLVEGKVVSVDLNELSCEVDPLDGGAEYPTTRITATIEPSANNFTIIPKVGSFVVIGELDATGSEAVVLKYTEVEKYIYQFEDGKKVELSADGFLSAFSGYQINSFDDGIEIKGPQKSLVDLLTELYTAIAGLKVITSDGIVPLAPESIQQINQLKADISKIFK